MITEDYEDVIVNEMVMRDGNATSAREKEYFELSSGVPRLSKK